jgi:hypothetical protein
MTTIIPIPIFFYDVKAVAKPYSSSNRVVCLLSALLYLFTIIAFVGTLTFYTSPSQRFTTETIISSKWQMDDYKCTPLQSATFHGFTTDWGYEQCLSNIHKADSSNVFRVTKTTSSSGTTEDHYDYRFYDGGIVSLYDIGYASSVLQTDPVHEVFNAWSRPGYSCYREPPLTNGVFNIAMNYSECLTSIIQPSEESLVLASGSYLFYPLGRNTSCYSATPVAGANTDTYNRGHGRLGDAGTTCTTCTIIHMMNGEERCLGITSNLTDAIATWTRIINTPADSYGNFYSDFVCNQLKYSSNGFRCWLKDPPTTLEHAIEEYNTQYPPETICAPLKQNAPFQCSRRVETSLIMRLSLSLASAQAIFSIIGLFFVYMLTWYKPANKCLLCRSRPVDLVEVEDPSNKGCTFMCCDECKFRLSSA